MRRTLILALWLAALLPIPAAFAVDIMPMTNVSFFMHGGARSMSHDFWAPTENQGAFAFEIELTERRSLYSILMGFSSSSATVVEMRDSGGGHGLEITGSVLEFYVGARTYFRMNPMMEMYVDAGASVFNASLEIPEIYMLQKAVSGAGLGGFFGGGIMVNMNPFKVGFQVRSMVTSEFTMLDTTTSANYTQLAITFGVGF